MAVLFVLFCFNIGVLQLVSPENLYAQPYRSLCRAPYERTGLAKTELDCNVWSFPPGRSWVSAECHLVGIASYSVL